LIHSVPKPGISPNFTIDDIHKIREWNYARTKDATPEEYREDVRHRAVEGIARIEAMRVAYKAKVEA
jgi:hypothetical protein